MNLAAFRKEYTLAGLRRRDLAENPILQFQEWLQQAVKSEVPEPTAMSVSTVDKSGKPSLRTVLLKAVEERGFVFCTNYESRKGQELSENSNAALLFFWKELERQVCIRGSAQKISTEESAAYFKARPVGSQLGAWVSQQSSVIENRETLEKKFLELEKKYSGQPIPLPPDWGGYVVAPASIEFWQGRVNRLHDRFLYTKSLTDRGLLNDCRREPVLVSVHFDGCSKCARKNRRGNDVSFSPDATTRPDFKINACEKPA